MRYARIGTNLVLDFVCLKVLSTFLQNVIREQLIILFPPGQQKSSQKPHLLTDANHSDWCFQGHEIFSGD